jgi:hypothetical protein
MLLPLDSSWPVGVGCSAAHWSAAHRTPPSLSPLAPVPAPPLAALSYLLLADIALNFFRSLVSKQWHDSSGWAGSEWAAALADRAAAAVAALARLHDAYLRCQDPAVTLRVAGGLWALAVMGRYLRWVGGWAGGWGRGGGQEGWRGVGKQGAATLAGGKDLGWFMRALSGSRRCPARLHLPHPAPALSALHTAPPQHLEPGRPRVCRRLHPARRLRLPPRGRAARLGLRHARRRLSLGRAGPVPPPAGAAAAPAPGLPLAAQRLGHPLRGAAGGGAGGALPAEAGGGGAHHRHRGWVAPGPSGLPGRRRAPAGRRGGAGGLLPRPGLCLCWQAAGGAWRAARPLAIIFHFLESHAMAPWPPTPPPAEPYTQSVRKRASRMSLYAQDFAMRTAGGKAHAR